MLLFTTSVYAEVKLRINPDADVHSQAFQSAVMNAFDKKQNAQLTNSTQEIQKANHQLLETATADNFKAKYQHTTTKAFQFVSNNSPLTVGVQPNIDKPQKISRPLYFMGADKVSLHWYQANKAVLNKLNATGFALNVSANQLKTLNEQLGIHLVNASTQGLAQSFNVTHYPFLVTAKGIFQ